jgi:serine/threonine-protein kinase
MPFTPGERVGAYQIIEQLGRGGMATVYKAYHAALDRYVAIKVLHPAFKGDANFFERFQREAQIVARLNHPHIVPVYDFAEHEGTPYLVMRYIEGETLKARLDDDPLPPDQAMRYLRPVAAALSYAHEQGVLHRDIKPSNVIIDHEGQVYLADFGLARIAHAGDSTLSRDAMIGTPQYISPEQAKGETGTLDARTDIYSLGVMLFEMLTGRVPFQADTPYAVVHDHIFTPLPPPTSLNPDLPQAVERVLLKALAKEPEDRYPDAQRFLQAYETVLDELQALAEPEPQPAPASAATTPAQVVVPAETKVTKKSRRGYVIAAVAVAALILLGACLGLGLMRAGSQKRAQRASGQVKRGDELVQKKDLAGAAAAYEQATKLDRQNQDAHIKAALAYLQLRKWDDAERHSRVVLQADPDNSLAHATLGLSLLGKGEPEKGRRELATALKHSPNLPLAFYGLGIYHKNKGEQDAANRAFQRVLQNPDAPSWLKASAKELSSSK